MLKYSADQGVLMVLPHGVQLDRQDLILLLFVVFERVVLHAVQLTLEQEIHVNHLQLVLPQSTLHLTVYAVDFE